MVVQFSLKSFKKMPPNRKAKLLEELGHLKQLIEFHIEYKSVLWENRESEFEEHLNGMLDYYNQIRKELEKLNTKKDKNGNDKK